MIFIKSAGIVRVQGVSNVGNVTRYNEQERKISGTWHDQEHNYSPEELCTYQGAALNGGESLTKKGTAFIRDGENNRRLYHLRHPRGHSNLTTARTFVQSFDYSLNPDLTPKNVHAMGEMLSDELHRYFQRIGYPVNDTLISTHLDRDQPKYSEYAGGRILRPHLHSHILIHSFNEQGKALSPILDQKSNMYDIQDLNDQVVDAFDLRDYRFAKLQHLIHPISAKTTYWDRRNPRSMSHLGTASQRYLNANRVARGHHPNDFMSALRYRDKLLRYNFGYRTKHLADLKHATSRDVFTMDDFKDEHGKNAWYNLDNLQALRWRNVADANVERLITHLDFNHVENATPTYHEYQKVMRYAVQTDAQAQHRSTGPHLKKQAPKTNKSHPDMSDYIETIHPKKGSRSNYLISLQRIFQRVRREEERVRAKANEYVRRIKVQIQHVKTRMAQRKRTRHNARATSRMTQGMNHRESEIYQYITFYGADRHGQVRSYRARQRIHPQTQQHGPKHVPRRRSLHHPRQQGNHEQHGPTQGPHMHL